MEILVSLELKYSLNSFGIAIKTKRPTTFQFIRRTIYIGYVVVFVVVINLHELGLNRPISVLSNSLFRGLRSSLRPFGL